MGILTLADAKAHLQITSSDYDDELQAFVDGITGAVERYKNEVIAPRAVTEDMILSGRSVFWLHYPPVISLTSVVRQTDSLSYTTSGYRIDPSGNGKVTVLTGTAPSGFVTVTYQAGYSDIPGEYEVAARIILQHAWDVRLAEIGTVGTPSANPNDDNYNPRYSQYTIPRRAEELLGLPRPAVA